MASPISDDSKLTVERAPKNFSKGWKNSSGGGFKDQRKGNPNSKWKNLSGSGFKDQKKGNPSLKWKNSSGSGFKDEKKGNSNLKRTDRGSTGNNRFKRTNPRPSQKKNGKLGGKEKKSQNKVEVLKKNEEYNHLVNSPKLTVFDWESTIVLRNLPAQIDDVKKIVQKKLKDIVKKFCPIKRTFKNNAVVMLACVLNNKKDVENAVAKLCNLKVGDCHIIVSRFVKPRSFTSNGFSACICNFPNDASEKHLSEILEDCGIVSSIDVEYSESGAMKKVLVNFTNIDDLSSLLQKDGKQLNSTNLEVVRIQPSTSVIVGNVHRRVSRDKLREVFGENALLVQKSSHMIFQIFFKDEKTAKEALSKDGESVRDLVIVVRPWSKTNFKKHKVFVQFTGDQSEKNGTFDVNELLKECGKLCSITPIKKNSAFVAAFESKEGQKAALQLNGNLVNGKTVQVTKKLLVEKFELKSTDQSTAGTQLSAYPGAEKNHVHFDQK